MSYQCRGCASYTDDCTSPCKLIGDVGDCPCFECLVKVMCQIVCHKLKAHIEKCEF
jgi:hypothetical protein